MEVEDLLLVSRALMAKEARGLGIRSAYFVYVA
jgi:hypothetical protein